MRGGGGGGGSGRCTNGILEGEEGFKVSLLFFWEGKWE